jgi:hypothetical protein
VTYLGQIRFTSTEYLTSAADPFDWAADEHDQKVDDAYFAATNDAELEVEVAIEDVESLKCALEACKDDPVELKVCARELAAAEKKLERCRSIIEKAAAKRAVAKSDYRKLLIKIANQIVTEEERM